MDLTPHVQEHRVLITSQGRVFKLKVMPFNVANARAPSQELMDMALAILRWRPVVQEVICFGARMEAHIDHVCPGTNNQHGHLILLRENCEFMQETMEHLGFNIGYAWSTFVASMSDPSDGCKS